MVLNSIQLALFESVRDQTLVGMSILIWSSLIKFRTNFICWNWQKYHSMDHSCQIGEGCYIEGQVVAILSGLTGKMPDVCVAMEQKCITLRLLLFICIMALFLSVVAGGRPLKKSYCESNPSFHCQSSVERNENRSMNKKIYTSPTLVKLLALGTLRWDNANHSKSVFFSRMWPSNLSTGKHWLVSLCVRLSSKSLYTLV